MRTEEEYVTCQNCSKNVRPVDLPDSDVNVGTGFRTCPVCQRSLEREIDEHNRKYGLKSE